jgi:DMSO/TMAO reductase YedYZ molybdopterin-dependent catalytic subunit
VWAKGIVAGGLATCALLGAAYALSQVEVVSFFPLDVAQAGIRLTPGVIATQGIEALGSGAKLLAEASALVLVLLVGAAAGGVALRLGLQRSWSNILPLAAAAIALIAAAQTLAGTLPDAIALGGTAVLIVGWAALLLGLLRQITPTTAPMACPASPARRHWLRLTALVLVAVAAGGGVIGEWLRRSQEAALALAIARGDPVPGVPLPTDTSPAFPVADPSFQPGQSMRPEATPLPALYIVSSELRSPNVDATVWRLTLGGLVNSPLSLSYADLRAMDRVEQPSTLTCISNEVGGGLTGTGVWSGVPLSALLDLAGVSGVASTIIVRSVTGYSDAIPLARALDTRTLVAYGFGDQALAREHGFPARLIIPGLYGMKNVKWLSGIEVSDDDYQGYWEVRGWDPSADVRTQSTTDTGNTSLENANSVHSDNDGLVVLGGYAFAGIRGISAVELNIDDTGWQSVQVKAPFSDITWRPWRYAWQAAPGEHIVTVRATDGAGAVQSAESLPPHPSGASGWHTLKLRVDGS